MQDKLKLLGQYLGIERVKLNVSLNDFFSTNMAAKSDGLYIATSLKELINAAKACQDLKLPFIVLGLGTKVVIGRDYIYGLVVKNRSDGIRISGIKGKVTSSGIGVEEALVEVDSGVSILRLTQFCQSQNLAGLENLSLEKGTLGGMMATGSFLLPLVQKIKIFNHAQETESRMGGKIAKGEIILSAIFKLKSKLKIKNL